MTSAPPGSATTQSAAAEGPPSGQAGRSPDGTFAEPAAAVRPFYRFWTTGGALTADSAAAQVHQMAAAGAGGVEYNQMSVRAGNYSSALHDWSNPSWANGLKAVFDAGKTEGIQVDHIYTPGWSAGTTTVSPDGVGADKKLGFGRTLVQSGGSFSGPVPAPTLPTGVARAELQGVVAYRCVDTCSEPVPLLIADSAIDLTSTVDGGTLTWTAPTAPAGTTWALVGAWMSGTGHSIFLAGTARPTYLVDHFAIEGFDAVRDYWEDVVLTPELESSIEDSGGSLFFDSLELNNNGVSVTHWTPRFLAEFEQRRGYSLVPYLAAVSVASPSFEFAGDVGARVREDYRDTLNELFRDNHLKPLADWAHDRNLTLRGQAYSSYGPTPIDPIEMAQYLDVVEGEDRSFGSGADVNRIETRGFDAWRALASASAQTGGGIVSTECCAVGQTQRVARDILLSRVNAQFAAGVNMIVWHGWGDRTPGAGRTWPGFNLFDIGDSFTPASPTWADDARINDYVARMQTVLRRGDLRNDVAIYRQGAGHSASGVVGEPYFVDQGLADAGYTYGFLNRTLVQDAQNDVRSGVLMPDTLGYKALVVNFTPNANYESPLDPATIEALLGWARGGLPIVIVGDVVSRTRGLAPAGDTTNAELLDQLLAVPSVIPVAEEAEVPAVLAAAGVHPDAQLVDSTSWTTHHRRDADTDYYYLWNHGTERGTVTVDLTGRGRPYLYDAWSGTVEPVSTFTVTSTGVRVRVDAASGDGILIGLTPGNPDTSGQTVPIGWATRTSADATAVTASGELVVRSTTPGRFSTSLSDGRTVTTNVASVAPSVPLRDWDLNVVAYEAGSTPEQTRKVVVDPREVSTAADGVLPSWQDLAGLENKSGVGSYETEVELEAAALDSGGVTLDLGTVLGTYQVRVNGRRLPASNLIDPSRIDITGYARVGTNVVRVDVATLLGNAAYGTHQPYGLLGPVSADPYVDTAVEWRLAPKARPSIRGVLRVGRTLTASSGTWTPAPLNARYRWYSAGRPVKGAGATLRLKPWMRGERVTVEVIVRRPGYETTTARSTRTGRITGHR